MFFGLDDRRNGEANRDSLKLGSALCVAKGSNDQACIPICDREGEVGEGEEGRDGRYLCSAYASRSLFFSDNRVSLCYQRVVHRVESEVNSHPDEKRRSEVNLQRNGIGLGEIREIQKNKRNITFDNVSTRSMGLQRKIA